uniref:solute carrier family 40 member 1-like n=1 Tax=Styela clava TaxID=7725 RepID=UPI0019399438|nr:solute carrier family 40 member 1-like [Styela clava]
MVNKSRLIYISHFLSTWSDRMWKFAAALFLMDLASDSLLLPAIYGLSLAGSVLILGPMIGNMIDRSRRLPAARVGVISQDLAIVACAAVLLVNKLAVVPGDWYLLFSKIAAVILGSIAHLAYTANRIIIEKDWIVVIADGDQALLTRLNSMLRRIDLFTKLIAPMVCGQIITLLSMTFGIAFVAGWNLISMIIEYIMLQIVYRNTPALARKKILQPIKDESDTVSSDDKAPLLESASGSYTDSVEEPPGNDSDADDETLISSHPKNEKAGYGSTDNTTTKKPSDQSSSWWKTAFYFIIIIPKGWGIFMFQSVALAGLGLSCLYMTVLGFDSITVSYAYNQCFSEFFVGLLMGASAITGIIATFAFIPVCKKFGLIRTGQFASVTHIITLGPCVYSVFAPGSPFFLLPQNQHDIVSTTASFEPPTRPALGSRNFGEDFFGTTNSSLFLKCMDGVDPPSSYLSLSMLMAGAVLARIGLWTFDLSVTQLFQEQVVEEERGVVNGVQSSINNFMDMIHFVLVIALPHPDQFGLLILISAFFIIMGHFLYAIYSRKYDKHFCLCR